MPTDPTSGRRTGGVPTGGLAGTRAQGSPNNPYNDAVAQQRGHPTDDGNNGDDSYRAIIDWMNWERDHNPNFQLPPNFEIDPQTNRVTSHQRSVFINHPWLIPVVGVGAGLGGAAATGGLAGGGGAGAAAAGTGSAGAAGSGAAGAGLASTTIAPTVGGLAPGVAASGAVPAALAGSGAAATGGGLMGIAGLGWGDIIGAGLSFLQSRQSANAAQQASQAQIDATNRALDLQRDQYNTSRQDYLDNRDYTRQQMTGLQPYQQAGAGALGTLQRLTGTQAPQGLAPTTQPYPGAAGAGPPGGYASTIRPGGGGGGTVTILDPSSGVTQQRPAGELQHWISVGGRQVG